MFARKSSRGSLRKADVNRSSASPRATTKSPRAYMLRAATSTSPMQPRASHSLAHDKAKSDRRKSRRSSRVMLAGSKRASIAQLHTEHDEDNDAARTLVMAAQTARSWEERSNRIVDAGLVPLLLFVTFGSSPDSGTRVFYSLFDCR